MASDGGGPEPTPHARAGTARAVPADWLALRRPADEEARAVTAGLLTRLGEHVRTRPGGDPGAPVDVVDVIDVGAGTGANQAWLSPRLPFPTRWTLVDHDPTLLSAPGHGPGVRVVAGVEAVPGLLRAGGHGPQLVTAAALLDLLTPAALEGLVAAAAAAGAAALFALTVTGVVAVDPADDEDAAIAAAFDAHQRRDGLAGPDAPALLRAAAARHGADLHVIHTPWLLDSRYPQLLERYLRDRAAVVLEQDPGRHGPVAAWLDRRLAQAEAGDLVVTVGHEDALLLPSPAH